MKCKKCGKQFEGAFCPECGTPADDGRTICPRCGNRCGPDEKFCSKCGHRLPADDPFDEFGTTADARESTGAEAAGAPPKPMERPKPSPLIAGLGTSFPFSNMTMLPLTILLVGYTLVMIFIGSATYVTTRDVISFAVGPVILTAIMTGIIYLIYRCFPWVPHGHKDLLKSFKQRRAAPDAPFKTHRKMLRAMTVLSPAILAAMCVALYFATKNIGAPFAFLALFAAMFVFGMILGRADGRKKETRKLNNMALYGSEKPDKNAKTVVTNGEVADAVYRYEEEWKNYLLYRAKAKAYNRGAVFTAGDANRTLFLKSTLPRMICIILSVVICAAQIIYFSFDLTNMLRADKTDGITIGMRVSDLPAAMGSPYESAGGILKYYDRRYTSLLKKNDDFDIGDIENPDDLEDALNQANELETTAFAYMEIATEKDDDGNDIVRSVFFDPSRTRRETEKKYIESVLSDSVQIAQHAATATVTVYIDYTDGSLFKGRTEATLKSGESTDTAGQTVTLTFYDGISGSTIELDGTVI